MEWSKAKNIIIILLVVLNVFLGFAINMKNNNKYILNEESDKNLRESVSKLNVFLSYVELPKKSFPMRNIEISVREVDEEKVLKAFFKSKDVSSTMGDNKKIYCNPNKDNEYVEIHRNGMVRYIKSFENSYDEEEFTRENSKKILDEFLGRTYRNVNSYKDVVYKKENNIYTYVYYNTYGKNLLFNDYIKASVYNDRIEVEVWGMNVNGYSGIKKDILSVDEVLFNFSKNISDTLKEPIYIDDIQIGYYGINDDLLVNTTLISQPYYKVSIKYGLDYYINAFTNEIYDSNLLKVDF